MSDMRKLYFRADAGPDIGYGHYIRSLALADMLKQDFDCTMFTQMPTAYQLQEAKEICPVVSLPSDGSKFEKFIEYLQGDEIVVLDNYFYTTDYQRVIKAKGCKLVCIDDMHDKHYVADVVINHGAVKLENFDVEPYTRLYLGRRYSLLRKPFLEHKKTVRQKGLYLVCFGGADPYNLTCDYVKYLLDTQPDCKVVAIIGDSYQYKSTLTSLNIEILQRLTAQEMADLLSRAEAIICSASTICKEALACGCCVYAGYYVDNQKNGYESLASEGWIIPLGDLRVHREDIVNLSAASSQISHPFNAEIIIRLRNIFKTL